MKLNKSDFIIEHNKNTKLTEYYQMDDSAKVLGQGSFGLVQSCIHKASCSPYYEEIRVDLAMNSDATDNEVRLEEEISLMLAKA